MLVLQLIKTGYKLGTFAIMPRQYRKDYISKNGNNYYLQFHIAEWMRQLPAFREYPTNKKNYKQTLKTSDPHEAAKKADAILIEMQIKLNLAKPLEQGADAYFGVLTDIKHALMTNYSAIISITKIYLMSHLVQQPLLAMKRK